MEVDLTGIKQSSHQSLSPGLKLQQNHSMTAQSDLSDIPIAQRRSKPTSIIESLNEIQLIEMPLFNMLYVEPAQQLRR